MTRQSAFKGLRNAHSWPRALPETLGPISPLVLLRLFVRKHQSKVASPYFRAFCNCPGLRKWLGLQLHGGAESAKKKEMASESPPRRKFLGPFGARETSFRFVKTTLSVIRPIKTKVKSAPYLRR